MNLKEDDIVILDSLLLKGGRAHCYMDRQFKTIKEAKQFRQQILDDYEKARKWDELLLRNAHIDFGEWLQDTKLRELIEELTDGDFQTITRAFGTSGIYTSIQLVRILDIFNRLQNLLEENKNEN